MNIPGNQKGAAQYQLKQDHQSVSVDQNQTIRKEDNKGNGLLHMINDSPSDANAEQGHPTLGYVIDTQA